MKRLQQVLVILVVVLVGLFLGKNAIAKSALSGGVKLITGLDAKVGGMWGRTGVSAHPMSRRR